MRNWMLDIRRAILLVRVALKFGAGPVWRRILRQPPRGPGNAVRFRLALEELGVTYLKLGQYLAMRFDILPPEVTRELNDLFEQIPPAPFHEVKRVAEAELGGGLDQFYSFFNPEPIAAASVAQVHQARTHEGQQVAVKIQRPGIEQIFRADMRNLRRVATLIDASGLLGTLPTREMVDEFGTWTLREMNFLLEGRTAERLRQYATPYEVVPKIYWELSTPRVLTMDFIEGPSLNRVAELLDAGGTDLLQKEWPGIQIEEVFHNLVFASFHQLFLNGFFHADPHPGNILVLNDNNVAFVDFGIFGQLNSYQRRILVGTIENVAVGNIEEGYRYYSQRLTPTSETDIRAYKQHLKSVLGRWYEASKNPYASIQERHLGKYSAEIFEVVRRHHLKIGADTLLFWRALNTLDANALRLSRYFDLDLLRELRAFFEQTRPGLVQRVVGVITDQDRASSVADLTRELPGDLETLLNRFAGRRYMTHVYELEQQEMELTNDKDAKRLSAALVALSLGLVATATTLVPPLSLVSMALAVLVGLSLFAGASQR